ncbi:MAG: hypothetical protein GWO20_06650 [Candidatus Korarchaeota archaeon]|nr:hypothetical protein [Candidatus Korarchaeota archaeon]NIU83128.1 hypothetical protein [Candidatus Thorarchaeota archaeon]NIW13502.1 hypothetical protein [Candidatus Thorarchaeota archaeon]NIW51600.1 hypothetical protein [Candidatus Korarchaeota archaeon]
MNHEEKEKRAREAKKILNQIARDANTPKNIRRAAREANRELENKELSLSVRSSNAIDKLQKIAEDPQIPRFARTSILEAIAELDDLTRD